MPTDTPALRFAEAGQYSQVRAFAGDVLYTEGMPAPHLYVVKEGEVDLYLVRDEKRTVVETLKQGQCFGFEPHLRQQVRTHSAAARSYCELYLVPADEVIAASATWSDLASGLLETLSERLGAAHQLIARRVNYQSDLLVYAQLLTLLGSADLARQQAATAARSASDSATTHPVARPKLHDLFVNARLMFGHSDAHIRACVAKLLRLHLVRVEDGRGNGKELLFAPKDLLPQVRKIVGADPEADKQRFEYISLDEFSNLVDVDRSVVLRKLAVDDFADDLFTFRRNEVMRLLDTKGRRYFAERRMKTPAEFADITDIEFADAKSVFTVVSKFDTLDLAKVLSALGEGPVRSKMLNSLSKRRREEVESDLDGLSPPEAMEVQQLGKAIIHEVKALMLKAA